MKNSKRKQIIQHACKAAVKQGYTIDRFATLNRVEGRCCPIGALILQLDISDKIDCISSVVSELKCSKTWVSDFMTEFDAPHNKVIHRHPKAVDLARELHDKYID